LTAPVFLSSPWLDEVAPDVVLQRPYRALDPVFLTVIAVGDDLVDLILDLQAVSWRSAETMAQADGHICKQVAFGAEELTLTVPEADQPIGLCALLMRQSLKGQLARTATIALLPFVDFDVFSHAIGTADARRRLDVSTQAGRRLRL